MISPPNPARSEATSTIILVDGLRLSLPFRVPVAPEVEGPPDWEFDFEDGISPLEDGLTTWSGDISHEGRRWGRFGHRNNRVRVHLEGIADLTACPITRTATLHRATTRLDDVGLLRRLMPYLLALDGRLVLHASCVALPDGAAVFCADATTGKSTLALALDAAGYPVLSDDHIVLDPGEDGVLAYPSFAYIEVGQGSRKQFRPETENEPGKISVPLRTPQPTGPIEVTHLVFLERGSAFSTLPLAQMDVSIRLLEDVLFGASPMDPRELAIRLDGAVALSSRLSLLELTLPDGLDQMALQLSELPALLSASP